MKITVRKSTKAEPKLLIRDIPVGCVFRIIEDECDSSGPTALKLDKDKFILLTHSWGNNWFVVGQSCWDNYPTKILGELTEIILEK